MDSNQTSCVIRSVSNATSLLAGGGGWSQCNVSSPVKTTMEWGEEGSFLTRGNQYGRFNSNAYVLIAYERFPEGTVLYHDPTFYTQSTSSSSIADASSQTLYNDTGAVIYQDGNVTSNWVDNSTDATTNQQQVVAVDVPSSSPSIAATASLGLAAAAASIIAMIIAP